MAYNPDSDDEWWTKSETVGEEEDSRTLGETQEKKKRKKRRKKITTVLAVEKEEPFVMRHTAVRQHHELSQTLLPHLTKSLLQVEAATVKLKVRHFFGFQPDEDYNLKESSDPDVAEFLTAVCPQLESWVEESEESCNGAPLLLMLTTSAIRAVELRRRVSTLCHKGMVAKLFAKHMKVEEQASFLSSRCTPIAVATPNRANKLIDQGSLKLEQLKCVLLDWYHRDQKQRRFSSVPEVWQDFCQLFLLHLNQRLQKKQLKLILY